MRLPLPAFHDGDCLALLQVPPVPLRPRDGFAGVGVNILILTGPWIDAMPGVYVSVGVRIILIFVVYVVPDAMIYPPFRSAHPPTPLTTTATGKRR